MQGNRACTFNKIFEAEVNKYVPSIAIKEMYAAVLAEQYYEQSGYQAKDKQLIISEINDQEKTFAKAPKLLLAGNIHGSNYRAAKQICEGKLIRLKAKLAEYADNDYDVKAMLDESADKLCRVGKVDETAPVEKKREIISLMYPEKLTFDETRLRTIRLNEIVSLIYRMDKGFRENKNETNRKKSDLSRKVVLTVQFSNYFIKDLERLVTLNI